MTEPVPNQVDTGTRQSGTSAQTGRELGPITTDAWPNVLGTRLTFLSRVNISDLHCSLGCGEPRLGSSRRYIPEGLWVAEDEPQTHRQLRELHGAAGGLHATR